MTTYSYSAHTLTYNVSGTPTSVASSSLQIVGLNDFAFVYFGQDVFGPDEFSSFIVSRGLNLKVNGVLFNQDGSELQIARLSWAGGSGIYMYLVDTSLANDTTTLIWMDGARIPANIMTNPVALDAVLGSAAPVPATGDFAPNDDISLLAFEAFIGLTQDDVAFGDDLANTNIQLEDGNDSYLAAGGNDEVFGGNGNDTLSGDAGRDTLYGDLGHDSIFGGLENDDMFGGIGNDVLNGDGGYDDLFGGIGNDTLSGGDLGDALLGEDGNDQLFGGAGNDVRLSGGAGHDNIRGGSGTDRLIGNEGRDVLNGDSGADDLEGGMQADRFVFNANMGRDTVRDFDFAEGDRIYLNRAVIGNQTGLTTAQLFDQYGTDLGDMLRFDFGGGNRIALLGVADLTELGNAFVIV